MYFVNTFDVCVKHYSKKWKFTSLAFEHCIEWGLLLCVYSMQYCREVRGHASPWNLDHNTGTATELSLGSCYVIASDHQPLVCSFLIIICKVIGLGRLVPWPPTDKISFAPTSKQQMVVTIVEWLMLIVSECYSRLYNEDEDNMIGLSWL